MNERIEKLNRFMDQMRKIVGTTEKMIERSEAIFPKRDDIEVDYASIKSYLNNISKSAARYAIVETETHFHIYRLIDNMELKPFYAKFETEEQKAIIVENDATKRCKKVLELIKNFRNLPIESVKKYDYADYYEGFIKLNLVPYGFLQRNTSSAPLFKSYVGGAKIALQKALSRLCNDGYIVEVARSETIRVFNTTAKIYQIKKEL